MLSRRLAVLTFAAIQSSTITLTNLLFDLASSPHLNTYFTTLTTEICTELASSHNTWRRKSLARMTHLDSAIRESMRLGGFLSRGVSKLVVCPDGVTLPDGTHVPMGIKVGVSQYSVHHDEDIYRNAASYDAFRFARAETDASDSTYGVWGGITGVEKRLAVVCPSPTFLAFSYGAHAWYVLFFLSRSFHL